MEPLIRQEEECFVLLDWEPARGAELVQTERGDLAGKPVSGIESIGVTVPECAAVNGVGSTLQPDVNYRPTFHSEFHTGVRLHVEFGNSFQRNQGRGCA